MHRLRPCVLVVVAAAFVAGCGSLAASRAPEASTAVEPVAMPVQVGPDTAVDDARTAADPPAPEDRASGILLAQAPQSAGPEPPDDLEEPYDPWESFNEKTFEFNRQLDRWILKPTARVYRAIIPEPLQGAISNGFTNIAVVPRIVNSLLQGKMGGAGRELLRFVLNSTAGIGGLFDPARDYWGIEPSNEDFGQTLGVWGSGPGPYLVVPLLPPLTVRDGAGKVVDMFMDPLGYVLPFLPVRLSMTAGEIVNERALNYDLFQGVEETTLDLYSSVRHFYLSKRANDIKK